MAKEKMQMEVGKRYKGYGVLNEYGEYLFTPCQKLEPSEKNMKLCAQTEVPHFMRVRTAFAFRSQSPRL